MCNHDFRMDDLHTFMLDSLRELQTTLLLLMEKAKRANVAEANNLEFALTDVIAAYRDLRDGRVTWVEAARVYQTASNVQLDCDMAVLEVGMANNYDWHMAKRVVGSRQERT